MDIPLLDLTEDPTSLAPVVDHALRTSGFLLVTGHGIDPALPAAVRAETLRFFHGDPATKAPYERPLGDAGWRPPGTEANAYTLGMATPPDLKEAFLVLPGGDNRHPTLTPPALAYTAELDRLTRELLTLLAFTLGDDHVIASTTTDPYRSLSMTWYPALERVGEPLAGQWRIGPHSDFGTITILDRQPGLGGLQIQALDGEWIDAPYVPGALTVNVGDLMARWTGDRWRSTMHRVLPPPADAPAEELLSLVFFVETNLDALIETFPPPIGGGTTYEPVTCGDYLASKFAAITV
ncbi:MAG: oxidoreductase [Actinomycetia bacterium]|nr:oxidoreductase [Actinomycetes bacterium]